MQVNVIKSYESLNQEPVTGVKTVTTTAAELFAGTQPLAKRSSMTVYNEGANNIYLGNGQVTAGTGFTILPGDSVKFTFFPDKYVPIYFIAEASNTVRVVELA